MLVRRGRGRPPGSKITPKGGTTAPTGLLPAAVRATEILSPAEADLNLAAVETFAKAVGGRDALIEVLSVADTAPEIDRLVNLLVDPRYARMSLRKICHLTGITVADLFVAYRKALIARAHIQASHIIAAKLPPIVDDVMTRATPSPLPCPSCLGLVPRDGCPTCRSQGVVRSEPDLDRQKLALELGQLTDRKGGGVYIQQNQITSTAQLSSPGGGALEQLQQAVGELLFGSARQRGQQTSSPMVDPPAPDQPFPREEEPELPFPHEEPEVEDDDEEDEDDDTESDQREPPP